MTDYEKQRRDNILRNNKMLYSLGLETEVKILVQVTKKPVRKRTPSKNEEPSSVRRNPPRGQTVPKTHAEPGQMRRNPRRGEQGQLRRNPQHSKDTGNERDDSTEEHSDDGQSEEYDESDESACTQPKSTHWKQAFILMCTCLLVQKHLCPELGYPCRRPSGQART